MKFISLAMYEYKCFILINFNKLLLYGKIYIYIYNLVDSHNSWWLCYQICERWLIALLKCPYWLHKTGSNERCNTHIRNENVCMSDLSK